MRPAIRRLAVPVLAFGLQGTLAVPPTLAASVITVNSLADVAANDGACTLREAITAANTDTASGAAAGECAAGSGTDAITFSVAGTITLSALLPVVTSDLSITGGGAITISGASSFRVFNIFFATVTLSGLTVTGGLANDGAGIASNGVLDVVNSTISGSTALALGGGILNGGTLNVTNSTISGNQATSGGGIFNNTGALAGPLTVTNSTISGNDAQGNGGGIANAGSATVTNSTISGNSAANTGGGILNSSNGFVTVTNATFSGNTGGGIRNDGAATVANSILAGNGAVEIMNTGSLSLTSNVLAGDSTGILVPAGLANNGGPTKTIALALVAGNPAIDAGTASACSATPVNAIDQRGLPRPTACDIGAYEAQPPTIAAHANVKVAVSPPAPTVVTYTKPAGTDEQGGVLAVTCTPPSGSSFPVGTTTLTCTATDAVGHTAAGSFHVVVSAVAAPSPPAPTPIPSLPNSATAMGSSPVPGVRWPIGVFGLLALLGGVGLVALRRARR